jgi:hypothetical protein
MPIMPYLTIAGMLVFVLFPVLLPAIITLVHTLTEPARTSTQERVAARTAPRRLAAAA